MKNNRLIRKYGLIIGLFGLLLILSACVKQADNVTFYFDKDTLSDSQKVYVQYSDGTYETMDNQEGVQEFTMPTDISKWIVGAYINEGIHNWVPDYSYTTGGVFFSNVASTKPTNSAVYAELQGTPVEDLERPGYVSVTFAVYGEEGLLDFGQTAVFARTDINTSFYNNNTSDTTGFDHTRTDYVNEGFMSYTKEGFVTFVIESESTDMASIPLELYSGNTQIYGLESNTLKSLSLSVGNLDTAFDNGKQYYSMKLDNAESELTVTAEADDPSAIVTVVLNGVIADSGSVTSGEASETLALAVGINKIRVEVTSENMIRRVYIIDVLRSYLTELSDLTLSEGTLSPSFSTNTISYSASFANSVSSLTVTPTVVDNNATVTVSVNGGAAVPVASGHASGELELGLGDNIIDVVVTAQNGATTKTYTLTVTRAALVNADLGALSLSEGTLSPSFSTNTISYSASFANSVSSLTVTPTVVDNNATVTVSVNGGAAVPVASGHASGELELGLGDNIIDVVVTAQNGATTKTYTLTVTRAASIPSPPPVNNNNNNNPTTPSKVISTTGQITLLVNIEGEVSLDKEVFVSIPEAASLQELKLTITKVTNTEGLLTDEQMLSSSVFEILKNFSENFSKPVKLSFVFDPASVKNNQTAAVFFYDEIKKLWVKVEDSKIVGNRIEVEVDHFTKFAVFAENIEVENPTTEAEMPINFNDISKHWAEASIKAAVREGIVTGYLDGTFKPGNKVTRAEFAVMLMNTLKLDNEGAELTFTDTEQIGAWAKLAVAQAVQAGIIKGYNDGNFRPNSVITRAEMATMIALAMELQVETNAVIGFADDKDIPTWARNAVGMIKQLDLVSGNMANEFTPNSPTTRAEAVTVLVKVLALNSK